jgi:hypothetical protein
MRENPDQLKVTIRERVSAGLCPQELDAFPVLPPCEEVRVVSESPFQGSCCACGRVGTVRPFGGLAFHDECFGIWQEVCQELRDGL